jgi:alpha-tubulin suppressor-like RCC1 family protein
VHQLGLPAKRLLKDDMGYVALIPTRVDEFVKQGKAIRGVACGEAHTLALDSDGRLYSFGWAEDGQLGLPLDRLKDGQMSFEIGEIPALRKQRVVKVAAGALFSACLTEEGRMYIWGNGEQGQLGLGNTIRKADLPTLQQALKEEVLDLICGENSLICITKSGKAHGWGQGVAGYFSESTFEPGTDLVSYVPKLLASVDIAHRLVVPKREEKKRAAVLDFNQALSAKLQDLQDYEDSV